MGNEHSKHGSASPQTPPSLRSLAAWPSQWGGRGSPQCGCAPRERAGSPGSAAWCRGGVGISPGCHGRLSALAATKHPLAKSCLAESQQENEVRGVSSTLSDRRDVAQKPSPCGVNCPSLREDARGRDGGENGQMGLGEDGESILILGEREKERKGGERDRDRETEDCQPSVGTCSLSR